MSEIVSKSEPPIEVTTTEEKDTIQQLSLKLLQQTELNNTLQQRIGEINRQLNQQKQLLVQARKEKHDADLEVTRLSTEVENITEELFEQANSQVREANVDAYNIKQLNERLSNTIKEKDTTIEILQTELSNLKNIISNMENSSSSLDDLTKSSSILNSNSKDDDTNGTYSNKNTNNVPYLSKQKSYIEDSSRFPNCALFVSKKLSPYNQKPIYSPLFNQIRFDSPAFNLFCDCLLPHISSHLTIADTVANELASHISSITSKPVLQSYNSSNSISNFDIRTTKFFLKLLDELDEDLRLDKAPSLQTLKLRWNRKNFLLELMDKSVTIEPLSASTESWKSQTLQKYMPLSNPPTSTVSPIPLPESSTSNPNSNMDNLPSLSRYSTSSTVTAYDPSLFKLASNVSSSNGNSKNGNSSKFGGAVPLAVTASCGLCGEKRRDMNFSRLYHIKIKSDHSNNNNNNNSSSSNSTSTTTNNNNNNDNNNHEVIKYDYPLCINCANKYRAVVELLKFLATIHPNNISKDDDIDDYIRHCWIKYVELKSKVWYTANIGIWNDKETFGLVYGWQNDWLTNHVKDEDKIIKEEQFEEQTKEKSENSIDIKNKDVKNSKYIKNEIEKKDNGNECIETTKDTEDIKGNKENSAETNDDISVNSSNKGWKGWSGVIAKPAVTNNVDVGIGLVSPKRVNSSNQPKPDSILSKDSKETDEDEANFEDANDGVD